MTDLAIVVIGVVYPAVTKYLDSYLESLEKQTFKKFDLILANDGVNDLENYLQKYSLKTIVYSVSGSQAKIRRDLIDITLKAGYEYIVFTDCDDYLSLNRIEECTTLLNNSHIIINDLDILSEDTKIQQLSYFSNRIDDGMMINSNNLLHHNMMGLTNVAVRREVLLKCIPFLKVDVVAFDWILWTHALLSGFKAQFTTSTSTKYRVYSSNIAGLPQEINHSTVSCGLSVKMMHYGKLASCNESYKQLYDVFSMAKEMSLDSTWLCEYIKALREEQMEYPMWWENIKTPEQVRML